MSDQLRSATSCCRITNSSSHTSMPQGAKLAEMGEKYAQQKHQDDLNRFRA